MTFETRVLLLPESTGEAIRRLDVQALKVFRPYALLLWGTGPDTFVRQLRVSWETALARPVPGSDFESDIPWTEFLGHCDPPDGFMPAVARPRELGVFRRLSLPAAMVAQSIEVTVEGPIEHAALVGDSPVDDLGRAA